MNDKWNRLQEFLISQKASNDILLTPNWSRRIPEQTETIARIQSSLLEMILEKMKSLETL